MLLLSAVSTYLSLTAFSGNSSFDGHVDGWFCPITITARHSVTSVECGYHVPKKELVGILQVLLQIQRLKIAKSLPFADILVEEMQNFKVKVTLAANETFGVWREGQNDDMVLSVALAAWLGESHIVYEGPRWLRRSLCRGRGGESHCDESQEANFEISL